MLFYLNKIKKGVESSMEEALYQLKDSILARSQEWEEAKDPRHYTSIFVCNRRIQKLDEALQLIAELELIDEYTKR